LAIAGGSTARARTYPDHIVKIVVPYTPRGITEILGRIVADKLNQRPGQPFIVENRPGAAGMIGSDFVVKANPDGYTPLVGSIANTIFPAVKTNVPYDLEKGPRTALPGDIHPKFPSRKCRLPYKSLKDPIAAAKAKPGKNTPSLIPAPFIETDGEGLMGDGTLIQGGS
jgi:tripartite-type tricarboxylate transporter receptor subunit TctC